MLPYAATEWIRWYSAPVFQLFVFVLRDMSADK